LVLLATLVGYGAGGFAGRLAGGLALAAACVFGGIFCLGAAWKNGFDHGIDPFLNKFAVILPYICGLHNR